MAWGPYDSGKGGGKAEKAPEEPSDNLYVTGLPPNIDDEFVKALFAGYGTVMQCRVLPTKVPGSTTHALVRFSSVDEATTIKNTVSGGQVDGSNEPLNCSYAAKPKPQGDSWGGGGKGFAKGKGDSWSGGGNDSWSGGGKGDSWGGGGGGGGNGGSWFGGCKGDSGKGGSWGDAGNGNADAGKANGGKGDGGKADGGKGKGGKGKMDTIMKAFDEAQCLPGAHLGNDHNNTYVCGLPKDCTDLHLYKLFSPFGSITPKGVYAVRAPDGSCKGFGFVNFIEASAAQAAVSLLNGAQLPDGSILKVEVKQ